MQLCRQALCHRHSKTRLKYFATYTKHYCGNKEKQKTTNEKRPCLLHKCTYLKHKYSKIIAHVRTDENKTGVADEESLNTHGLCQHKAIVNHATMAHRRPTATNPVNKAMCSTHQGQGAQPKSRCTTEKKKITLEGNTVQGGVFRGRMTHTQKLGASQKLFTASRSAGRVSHTPQRMVRALKGLGVWSVTLLRQ